MIVNSENHAVYTFLDKADSSKLLNQTQEKRNTKCVLSSKQEKELKEELKRTGVRLEQVLERYHLSCYEEMSQEDYKKAMNILKKMKSVAA